MNAQMMTYFCVAYGPSSAGLDAPAAVESGKFRRADPAGTGQKPARVSMIHRDIDAPVAVGISQCLETAPAGASATDLQLGDPQGRVRIGRFHPTAEEAIEDMKRRWPGLQAAGMVYAELCCMEVSAASLQSVQ